MFCHYCGQQLFEDMSFCVRCGRPTTLSADTTGPLPRLDEQGNPVAQPDEPPAKCEGDTPSDAEGDAVSAGADESVAAGDENDVAVEAARETDEGSEETSSAQASDSISIAPLLAASDANNSAAPVIMLRKSRKPLVIGFVVAALLIGCICFAGGALATALGVIDVGQIAPAAADTDATGGVNADVAGGVDADAAGGSNVGVAASSAAAGPDAADDEGLPGKEDADDVAAAVQEGWEAMIADNFSTESQATWMETVLSMQPEGVIEALGALAGVEGDSLLPLFLSDGLPLGSASTIEEFLDGSVATVVVDQSEADKAAMAVLMGYFGDLGQTVSGQVESLNLPSDVQVAEVLEVSVAPAGESAQDAEALAVGEKGQGYMAYEYEGRWYLLAPELQRATA